MTDETKPNASWLKWSPATVGLAVASGADLALSALRQEILTDESFTFLQTMAIQAPYAVALGGLTALSFHYWNSGTAVKFLPFLAPLIADPAEEKVKNYFLEKQKMMPRVEEAVPAKTMLQKNAGDVSYTATLTDGRVANFVLQPVG